MFFANYIHLAVSTIKPYPNKIRVCSEQFITRYLINIVSFDDTSTEVPWGMGYTPEEALKDAANKWNLKSDTEEEKKENPFREIKMKKR